MSLNSIWWETNELLHVSVSGMFITKLTTTFEVGSLPSVNFDMNVNAFLEKLSEDELEKIFELIKKIQITKLRIGMPLCIHGFKLDKCKTCWK